MLIAIGVQESRNEWAYFFLAADFAVMKNPANLAKHQANPKVAPVIAKMMAKFAGPK
ncbi:FAM10 family protein [Vitis vinifera]|uniref:FAM10 family protein n=1 Tax=Vitis vinifera TaxID=29760 RepID=A0A438ESJ3_VITVI|nr:FAM10 family protein [Vitis vinifera]